MAQTLLYSSDWRTIPKAEIKGAITVSDVIPKTPNAKRVIVAFLPRLLCTTKMKGMDPAPTTAPPPGQTWYSPHLLVQRDIFGRISISGKPVFDAPATHLTTSLVSDYLDPAHPNPLDFSGKDTATATMEVLPVPFIPVGVDTPPGITPPAFQGYLVGFNAGDGSGVVELVQQAPQRVGLRFGSSYQSLQSAGHCTEVIQDFYDGFYAVVVWG